MRTLPLLLVAIMLPQHAKLALGFDCQAIETNYRLVSQTLKDGSFSIKALCNPNADGDWSPRSTFDAANDIRDGIVYYTRWENKCALVKIHDPTSVTTAGDSTTNNNLECLPDCYNYGKIRRTNNDACKDLQPKDRFTELPPPNDQKIQ